MQHVGLQPHVQFPGNYNGAGLWINTWAIPIKSDASPLRLVWVIFPHTGDSLKLEIEYINME